MIQKTTKNSMKTKVVSFKKLIKTVNLCQDLCEKERRHKLKI